MKEIHYLASCPCGENEHIIFYTEGRAKEYLDKMKEDCGKDCEDCPWIEEYPIDIEIVDTIPAWCPECEGGLENWYCSTCNILFELKKVIEHEEDNG